MTIFSVGDKVVRMQEFYRQRNALIVPLNYRHIAIHTPHADIIIIAHANGRCAKPTFRSSQLYK